LNTGTKGRTKLGMALEQSAKEILVVGHFRFSALDGGAPGVHYTRVRRSLASEGEGVVCEVPDGQIVS
jgi:hypothetical protein